MTPTWKRFYFSRRHPSLTLAQFPERWRQHARLGATFPDGMKRHTRLNYALVDAAHSPTGARQYDGIGILWLGSPAMLDRVNDDPNCTPTMRRDELFVFTQPVYNSAMVVEEHICKAGPLTKFALLRYLQRAEGISDAAFGEVCETIGRALSSPAAAGRVSRCAWGTAVRPPTIGFDSCMEFWFDTREEAVAAARSAAFKAQALEPLGFAVAAPEGDALYVVEICHERVTEASPAAGPPHASQ
jgi:hypothetical protein